jgi:hypothetical protein
MRSEGDSLEIRRWADLTVDGKIEIHRRWSANKCFTSVDASERWIAICGYGEEIVIVNRAMRDEAWRGGGWVEDVYCLRFSPSGNLLACIFGGQACDGYVELYAVQEDGSLERMRTLDLGVTVRSGAAKQLIPYDVAFSPDSQKIIVRAGNEYGDHVALFAAESGQREWCQTLLQELPKILPPLHRMPQRYQRWSRTLPLEQSRRKFPSPGEWWCGGASRLIKVVACSKWLCEGPERKLLSMEGPQIVCGDSYGILWFVDLSTGEVTGNMALSDTQAVGPVEVDGAGTAIWAVLGGGELVVVPIAS